MAKWEHVRYLSSDMPSYREVVYNSDRYRYRRLAHLEMVATIVHQLTVHGRNPKIGLPTTTSTYSRYLAQATGGVPFNANQFQSKAISLRILRRHFTEQKRGPHMITSYV